MEVLPIQAMLKVMETFKARNTSPLPHTETKLFGPLSDELVREFAQIAHTELAMELSPEQARDMAQWLAETYTILLMQ